MKSVSPKEAKALMDEGWTYLDVRSEAEFGRGHPAGAINVPLMHAGPGGMTPNPDFLRVVQGLWKSDAKLVVGCMAGPRSTRATQLLESNGYAQVVNQRAGWAGARDPSGGIAEPGWAAEQLPAEEGQPADRCYAELRKKVP